MKKITLLSTILIFYSFCLYSQVVTVAGQVLQITQNSSETLMAVSDGESVNLFDTTDYSPVCILDDGQISKTAFYSDGGNEYIALITQDGQYSVRKLFRTSDYWSYDPEEPYFSADCSDSSGRRKLSKVTFSNNTDYVATAFSDNSIKVHFRLRGTQSSITKTLTGHKAKVYGLEFSRNGDFLASVSTDGAAYIWNTSTGLKIAQIKNVYTRANIPVSFTEDSLYIVSQSGRNSFRISDFSGNTLYSIVTAYPIIDIKVLRDADLIAVRNENNEILVYSISAKRPVTLANIPVTEANCTTFDFNSHADRGYAGFDDGTVQLLETQPCLDDSSMMVTDVAGGEGNVSQFKFTSVTVSGGACYLSEPYLVSANLRGEYLYSQKISPFFIGGGLDLGFGFPRSDFPATYKILGEPVGAPNLINVTLYVPAGYAFSLGKDISILTSLKAGARLSALTLISQQGSVLGKTSFAFFMGGGVGLRIKFIEFDFNCEYDTIGSVSPSLYAGYIFRWGETL